METSLFARGVWGKGVSKRKGPLEGIRLSGRQPDGGPQGRAGLRFAVGEGIADGEARRLAERSPTRESARAVRGDRAQGPA